MNKFQEETFLSEILYQCHYCRVAVGGLNVALREQDAENVFRWMYYILLHAAAISKLLWPISKKAQARGKFLRGKLGILENHVLKSRKLRDHYEHFDERLDTWANEHAINGQDFIDKMVGPRRMLGGIPTPNVMRQYDQEQREFIFRGERFNIQDLIDGILDVQNKATERQLQLKPNR